MALTLSVGDPSGVRQFLQLLGAGVVIFAVLLISVGAGAWWEWRNRWKP